MSRIESAAAGGSRKYIDTDVGGDRFLPTEEDWRDILRKAQQESPGWMGTVLNYLYLHREREDPVSSNEIAHILGRVIIRLSFIDDMNKLLKPLGFSVQSAPAAPGIRGRFFALYYIPDLLIV